MMRHIPTFADGQGNTVVFRRVNDVPGFTHRVIINQVAKDWLAVSHKPNARNADYFLQKHQASAQRTA